MPRIRMFKEPVFLHDLGAATLGGLLAVGPCSLVAFTMGPTLAGALLSCLVGTWTLYATMAFASRARHKLLPGLTSATLSGGALGLLMPVHPVLATLSFGGFFGLARASAFPSWGQKLGLVGSSAGAALLGGLVFGQISTIPLLVQHVPAALVSAGLFAAFGFFMGLGSLPAHVNVRPRLVERRYRALSGCARTEVRDHVLRTWSLHERFQKALAPGLLGGEAEDHAFEDALDSLLLRIFDLCGRWHEIENHLTSFRIGEVEGRLLLIEEKIRNTADEKARESWEKTRATLTKRTGDHHELIRIKERLVSDLAFHLTALEDLYFTVVRARCADPGQSGAELDRLLRNVTALTEELAVATRSIDELTSDPVALLPRPEDAGPGSGQAAE